jgi:hypothetical protein
LSHPDAADIAAAGDHDLHGGRKPSGGDPLENILERAAGAREQDGEAEGHVGISKTGFSLS